MARGKKKEKDLTPEEKLQQALVPVDQQPYEVPENWRWVRLSHIVDLFNGDRGVNYPSKKDYVKSGIPFINAGAIQEGRLDFAQYNYISQEKYDSLRAGKVQINDILYCLRGSLGKTAIVDFESEGAISSSLCILRVGPGIIVKYLYYLLNSDVTYKQQNVAENGSAQPNLSAASVMKYGIPLPPLPEQQRIVDRIESLFAKLDEAKERAQAVVDGFEDRKAAILHKAFTGELTAEWRNNHGHAIAEWGNCPLETVFQLRSGSTIDVSEEREYGAIPYVKVADMNLPGNEIQITTSSRFVDKCPQNHVIPEGSTIFPKRGGAILTNKKRYVGVDKIIADLNTMAIMPIEGKVYGWYGYYWMQSVDLRQLNNGSNVPQINNKDMVKLFCPKPSINEQKELVNILDRVFEKEFQIKESAEQVINQIEVMKKSILARAFRGELGTNEPTDESAEELLKKIL